MEINLRDYQQKAIEDLHRFWARNSWEDAPIVQMPTGAGKSIVIAELVRVLFETWPEHHPRTLIIVPSKELAEQNAEKLLKILPSHIRIGYYSSSLGRKDSQADVIVSTIGSVYKSAAILGNIRCVIIDECHLVNNSGTGMYRSLLNDLSRHSQFVVAGFTATSFRGNGVWLTQGKDPLFAGICHETKISALIRDGYLSPLSLPEGGVDTRIDTSDVKVASTGDYAIAELEGAVQRSISDVAAEAARLASDRQRVIAFTPQVASAEALAEALRGHGWTAEIVCGSTPASDREQRIAAFRAGRIRCLVTVLALATGFDVPDIDCIIWSRPSRSPVLYVQGVGRGMRTAPEKSDCLWLDFTDTTDRLGPVDEIRGRNYREPTGADAPFAICPECQAVVRPASLLYCPYCETQMREDSSPLRDVSKAPILSSQRKAQITEYDVTAVHYYRHSKPGSPDSIRVVYMSFLTEVGREWVCPQHGGWAASKAVSWLTHRALDPAAVRNALVREDCIAPLLQIASAGGLRAPTRIRVNRGGKYPEVVAYDFDQECVT